MALILSTQELSAPGGVGRAQRLLSTIFYRTRSFDLVAGPAADPLWLETLSPIAEHAALFHMATLYLYPVRDPHGDDAGALLAGDRALWWAPRPT